MQQEAGAFLRFHLFYFDALSDTSRRVCTSGQQNMCLPPRWQEVLHYREVIGIIENEQPAGMLLEPVFDGLNDAVLLLLLLLREIQ